MIFFYHKGWNFYTNGWKTGNTVYLKALGYRDMRGGSPTGTGAVTCVNENGRFWSAGAYSSIYARRLDFYSSYIYPLDYSYRSFGSTIWAVLE